MLRVFFFSVSAVAFSVECLIFQYCLYAESIVTASRSDPPLVFFFFVVVIVKTCRRKEMAPLFHFTCKHSAPQNSIWNIFYLFQNWNSRSVERRILGIILYVFLLRSSQVIVSVGSVVFKSESQKRLKKSSKKRRANVNVNSWIIIICFCINGYCMQQQAQMHIYIQLFRREVTSTFLDRP